MIKFKIGLMVNHKLFDYKGVIFGAARAFSGTDTWYKPVAKNQPPKESPGIEYGSMEVHKPLM